VRLVDIEYDGERPEAFDAEGPVRGAFRLSVRLNRDPLDVARRAERDGSGKSADHDVDVGVGDGRFVEELDGRTVDCLDPGLPGERFRKGRVVHLREAVLKTRCDPRLADVETL
jgi:hypothetical protein